MFNENSPRYQTWFKEQEAFEEFQRHQEERPSEINHRKWLQEKERQMCFFMHVDLFKIHFKITLRRILTFIIKLIIYFKIFTFKKD